MSYRRSLKLPIVLAIVMIVLLLVLTVGWVVLAVLGIVGRGESEVFHWTMLLLGTTFLALVLVGVIIYLTLSIKAINLTRRQSNFIDSVTHELKSPIASLKLYLQTLNRRQVSQEEQEQFYRDMLEDVERLDDFINHVLEAAQLEKGGVDEEVEEVELADLLRQCAKTVCLRYRVPPQTVTLDVEPALVRAARVDLELIFRNLMDNAVKYAGSEPKVVVTLRRKEDGGTLTRICDNGQGIPHHFRRKIWGRFVRLGLELERKRPGTGLGLYIVRTLVSRLRGRVRVRDPASGTGTVFEVHLPGTPPEAIKTDGRDPAAAKPSDLAQQGT